MPERDSSQEMSEQKHIIAKTQVINVQKRIDVNKQAGIETIKQDFPELNTEINTEIENIQETEKEELE